MGGEGGGMRVMDGRGGRRDESDGWEERGGEGVRVGKERDSYCVVTRACVLLCAGKGSGGQP